MMTDNFHGTGLHNMYEKGEGPTIIKLLYKESQFISS